MPYNFSSEGVDLPPGFRPTMCTFTGDFVVLTDVEIHERIAFLTRHGQIHGVGYLQPLVLMHWTIKYWLEKKMGTLSWLRFMIRALFSTHYKLQKSVAVTAFIRTESVAYVAHGRTVSRLLDLSQTAMRAGRASWRHISRAFEGSVTVPGDEDTFMLKHEYGVVCFAGSEIYEYSPTLNHLLSSHSYQTDSRTVLCAIVHDEKNVCCIHDWYISYAQKRKSLF